MSRFLVPPRIVRVCAYRTENYNLLPCVLVTPHFNGVAIALKLWNFHLGIKLRWITRGTSK